MSHHVAPRGAIVGAGFGGLGAAIELERNGITTYTLFGKSSGVGGVWRANHYPGAACDVATVVQNAFRALRPLSSITGYVDLLDRMWSDDHVAAYQAMNGWSNDHIPFPGARVGPTARQLLLRLPMPNLPQQQLVR